MYQSPFVDVRGSQTSVVKKLSFCEGVAYVIRALFVLRNGSSYRPFQEIRSEQILLPRFGAGHSTSRSDHDVKRLMGFPKGTSVLSKTFHQRIDIANAIGIRVQQNTLSHA